MIGWHLRGEGHVTVHFVWCSDLSSFVKDTLGFLVVFLRDKQLIITGKFLTHC